MSESQGRNRLIVTAQSLPASLQAFQWGEKLLGSETTAVPGPGDPWVRTMCTTMMVLATMALILRQRFSNKIQPWVPNRNWYNFFLYRFGHSVYHLLIGFGATRKRKVLNSSQYKLYKMFPPSPEHSHVQKKKKNYQKKNASVWEKVWKRKERLVCTIDLKLPLWLFWSLPQAVVCGLSWWLHNNRVFQLFLKKRWMEEKIAELLSSWLLSDSKCNLPSPGPTYTLSQQSQTNGTWRLHQRAWEHLPRNIRSWEKAESPLLRI